MIPVREVVRLLSSHRSDQVVVTHMTNSRQWPLASRREELDLPLIGCMGKASSLGLGVALARPDRKVWVFDSDGALLMNLGTLVTIAHQAPSNLYHFVFQNNIYETSGGQPVPGLGKFNFRQMALAAGYPGAYEFDRLETFALELPGILAQPGPRLICLRVPAETENIPLPNRRTIHAVKEVMAALAKS